MQDKILRNTIFICLLTVILMLVNIKFQNKGRGELYPFFHFELYSKPDGLNNYCSTYRLLIKMPNDTNFVKVGKINHHGFDQDDFYYASRKIIDKINKNQVSEANATFFKLAKFLYPSATNFMLVEEEYNLDDFINGNYKPYNAKVIISL